MTTIISAKIVQPIALLNIPKGEYTGTWSGYQATAIINGEIFEFITTDGVRGIDVKCVVSVGIDSINISALADD